MKQIFLYLKPYRFRMAYGVVIKVLGTFADLGLPWVLAYILDDVIPTKNIRNVLLWGVVMLFLAIVARQLNIYANRMASTVARNSVEEIRHDLFQKIGVLSGSQTDRLTLPSLVSRMTSDTYNIHQMIGMMQRLGIRAPIILVGGIIITATLEPVLTLVLVACLPLLGFIIYKVSKKGIPMYGKVQNSVDIMVRTLRENISGIRVIKALSKGEYEKRRFKDVNSQVVSNELKAGSIMAISGPVMNLLLNVGQTLVIVAGAYRVNAGASEPGKIVAFLTYFTMILNAMMMVTRIFITYSKASASGTRISEVLHTTEDLKVLPTDKIETPYHIEFNHVSFAYHTEPINEDNPASETQTLQKEMNIEHINFQMKRGEMLGIIGATGSGKTTLIQLLMRFYDVSDGNIRIDGRDIRTIPLQELREKFGVAFQNDIIFADSIFENICLGRELSETQVEAAAEDACAAAFIAEKKNGYQYKAAIKGADLSGGQKQRMLIARALAAHPEILILDDSSSALDYKTDAGLRQAIKKNYKETTIVTIAQRISSIMQMDHILVLEDGKMLGYGNHQELMKTCAIYREIYESQMGSEMGAS